MDLLLLELKKNRLKSYWITCGGIFLAVLMLGALFLNAPAIMEAQGDILSRDEEELFTRWENLQVLLSSVSMVSFAILSCVMHSRIIVSEYTGKKSILLFSYPRKHSSILWAKCILVFGFTCIMMSVCNIAAISLLALISNSLHLMVHPYTMEAFQMLVSVSIVLCLLSGAVGLVAMRIGFWKKSVQVTIVAGTILVAPCSNLFSVFMNKPLPVMGGLMAVLLVIGAAVFLNLTSQVNRMEVL